MKAVVFRVWKTSAIDAHRAFDARKECRTKVDLLPDRLTANRGNTE